MLLLKVLDFMTDSKDDDVEREIERETVKVGKVLITITAILLFLAILFMITHMEP